MGRASLRLHRVARWGVLLFLAAASMTCAPAVAAPQNAGQSDAATRELLLERDVADLRNSSQQSMQAANQSAKDNAQALNTRIDDLKSRIGDLTIAISLIAPFITILAVFVGIASYWSAGQRAKAAAEEWMDDHSGQFRRKQAVWENETKKIQDALIARVDAGLVELEESLKKACEKIGASEQIAEQEINRLKEFVGSEMKSEPAQSEVESRGHVDEVLKEKAEGDFTPEDWRQRARLFFAEGAFEQAALFYQRAIEGSGDSSVNRVKSSLGRGASLAQLNRTAEAIAIFDSVVTLYSSDSTPALRESVAKCLVNKGILLLRDSHFEEAEAVYSNVFLRYGNDSELALREQVAKALVGKGLALSRLKRIEDGIAAFDSVISRGGNDSDALCEQLAKALVNKGLLFEIVGNHNEASAAYDRLVELFGSDGREPIKRIVIKGIERKREIEHPQSERV